MRIGSLILALAAAGVFLLSATAALAAPAELTVRIEGATQTLFEGPILSDGHDVRAAGDPVTRRCDGTNGNANPGPGPTPTAAGVDAMALAGQDFGAKWFPGLDDYYLERWGPDRESFSANGGAGAFWGLLVNGVFSSVGGCQRHLAAGDEVLWAYDAFDLGKPFLTLGASADPAAPVAYVDVGEPLALSVRKRVFSGVLGVPPGIEPVGGVPVALVSTDPSNGFQSIGATQATSAADGSAAVSFGSSGWRRLKASQAGAYIRSNRLDVCVRPSGGGDCGPLPADAAVRVPPPIDLGDDGGGGDGDGNQPQPAGPAPTPPGGGAPPLDPKAKPKAKKKKKAKRKRCGKKRRAVKRKGRVRCVKR